MNNFRRLLAVNIIILVLLVGGGFAGWYFLNQSATYLTTDNAKIDGQPITIAATAAGQLVDWNGEVGKTYQAGERVGTIQVAGGAPTAAAAAGPVRTDITFPMSATIVEQTAVKNSFVTPGTPLAHAFDLDHLWVTANIKETDINDVKVGQDVDVYVDAYLGTTLKGKVNRIGLATANTFSLLPSSNNTANYTKVTQVIPVTITFDGYKGLKLMPGMNVTVRIHK
ncbi:HlyD family secretion protein [Effusibacillus pohliae]|uniref:HlyD family secretion protein n=1 Tax=Effusibacillus pohliae TaxID=232270 RepID=UPI000362D2D3|nr:HlyD family efflux transporter periplasmic adaptor subunit [Effusibacillus pohliae]